MPTDPIERRRHPLHALLALAPPALLAMVTLGLTALLAFESSQLQGADQALREYDALERERPQEKLYQAWKKIRYEQVLKIASPPLTELDEYQKLAEAARELGDRRGALRELLRETSELRLVPPAVSAAWDGLVGRLVPAAVPRAAADLAALPESNYVPGSDCDLPAAAAPARGPARRPAPGRSEIETHVHELECFLQALKISPLDFGAPLWSEVYATRSKVSLLVGWLLPGLYGVLGGCVHLLRQMLRREVQAGALLRGTAWWAEMLRIPLGGLAGIVIGWFWVPSGSVVIAVSSLPFGIAFLAGYGTEGLFAQLDRLVRQLSLGGNRRKAAAKAEPAA